MIKHALAKTNRISNPQNHQQSIPEPKAMADHKADAVNTANVLVAFLCEAQATDFDFEEHAVR